MTFTEEKGTIGHFGTSLDTSSKCRNHLGTIRKVKEKGVRNAALHEHHADSRPDAYSWQERMGQERLVMTARQIPNR